jgi:two-component system, NtrC family, sensor kinase
MRRFHLDPRAFRSRVARRIFLVFGASALLPVVAFAAFTVLKVNGALDRAARERLRDESKVAGMAILDRLVASEITLQLLAPEAGADATASARQLRSIARVPGYGASPEPSDPLADLRPRDASEWAHLAAGRSLLRVRPAATPDAPARLFLVRAAPEGSAAGLVIAELEPSQVWRPDALRADMGLVVRDARGRILFASAPELARAEDASRGDQVWIAGEPELRASWTLFLGSMFGADGWSIDCLQPKALVLGPLAQFRAAFIPVASLAGALVLFLSSGLIRRSLGPIESLHAATDAVAQGDFEHRVKIDTNDEFRDLGDAFNDMTGRISDLTRNLEAKVAARTRELQEALDELRRTQGQLVHQEKMASLGHFVAGIAHELNNPLAFVEGNLHFLRQYTETLVDALSSYDRETGDADPRIREKLAAIRSELDLDQLFRDLEPTFDGCADGIQRATTLVEDLRTFSRNDVADRAAVDLGEALDSTLNILRGRLEGVDLVRDYGELPLVECQPAQLNQVFLNLVSNALDATDDGGRVVIRTRRLGAGRVSIEVEDDGCGMDAETARRVFEPFYTTKAVGRGTGLGLSVSYGIVERHGGLIEVESEPGRGTRFRVTLPTRLADEPQNALDRREPESQPLEPQEMTA